MPFSPLPKTFLEDLQRRRRGHVLEVGCGDGALSQLIQAEGISPWRLDRRRAVAGSVADVVADARHLPVRPGSVDMLVAGNLLRHLWSTSDDDVVPADWHRCIAPGGCLYILEDEPATQPPAVKNYLDLQDLLARLIPEARRPLLSQAVFSAALKDGVTGLSGWRLGQDTNHWPADPQAVLTMLKGQFPVQDSSATSGRTRIPAAGQGRAVQKLITAIERHGLSYGQFWWARWSSEVRG